MPDETQDPPARIVIEKLNALLLARKGRTVWGAPALVGTKHVRDLAEDLGATIDFYLPEVFFGKDGLNAANLIFGSHESHFGRFAWRRDDEGEPGPWGE
jgi:hypothetical protein